MSDEFPINRGVRQGDPLSPKLLSAVMEVVDTSEGINVYGENLTNLSFADDVALFNKKSKQMEKHLNILNLEKYESWPKIHKGKTKYTANYENSDTQRH